MPGVFGQAQFDKGMGCAVETTAGQRGSGRFDTPRPRVPPSGIPRVPCANCVRVHMSARPGSPPVGSGTSSQVASTRGRDLTRQPTDGSSARSPGSIRQAALVRCPSRLHRRPHPARRTARYFEHVRPIPGLRRALWRHRSSPPCQAPRSEIHYRFSRYTSRQDLFGFDERFNGAAFSGRVHFCATQ